MIEPDMPKHIIFSPEDQPDLDEVAQADKDAARKEQRRRREELERWIDKCQWNPFGMEW